MKRGNEPKENSTSKCGVIWDGNYPKSLFNTKAQQICNPNELKDCDLTKFEIIFILTELKWPGHILRSNFYGFQLGADLRKKKELLCPIVFCSFMPEFDKGQYPSSKILDYPGHYYLQLPNKPLAFDNYKGLDEDVLDDINISLFDPNQQIHDLMHNTENRCPELAQGSENKEEIKTRVLKYLSDQLNAFKNAIVKNKLAEFENLKVTLLKEIKITIDNQDFKPDKLRKPLNNYKEQFYSLLPCDLTDGLETNSVPKRWQVLFIDDQLSGCESINNHFSRNGITCHTAQTAEKAFSILKDDENSTKKIAVIISDLRLYVNGDSESGKWQDLQGYQILKQIHSHHEFKSHYAYIILTSKKGTIQQYIKKHSEFPILWFNKTDVLAGEKHSFNIFCQRIIEVGSDAFLRKKTIPAFGGWKNAIKGKVNADFNYRHMYYSHVEDLNYEQAEVEINMKAIELSEREEIQGESILQPAFNSCDKDKLLQIFRNTILLYRRIFLTLKYKKELSDFKILKFFIPDYPNKIDEDVSSRYIHALFYANWGFQKNLERIKWDNELFYHPDEKFLIEEMNFLKSIGFSSLSIDNDEEYLWEFLYSIKALNWSSSTEEFINRLLNKLSRNLDISYLELKKLFSAIRQDFSHKESLETELRKTNIIYSYTFSEIDISERFSEMFDFLLEGID